MRRFSIFDGDAARCLTCIRRMRRRNWLQSISRWIEWNAICEYCNLYVGRRVSLLAPSAPARDRDLIKAVVYRWRALLSSTSSVRAIGNAAEKCVRIPRAKRASQRVSRDPRYSGVHVYFASHYNRQGARVPELLRGFSPRGKIPSLPETRVRADCSLSLEITTAQICRVFNPSAT